MHRKLAGTKTKTQSAAAMEVLDVKVAASGVYDVLERIISSFA